jgi:antitoxin component YwqK of YwqJK toxin-antitoxin module
MYRFLALGIISFLLTACVNVGAPQGSGSDEVVATRYVHQYGVTIPQYQWEEFGQNGQIITTTQDGVTCHQTYYCGALEGDSSYTFPFSNNTQRVETYSQDVLTKEVTYHPTGQKQIEKVYHPTEPTSTQEWYENGVLKSHEKHAGSLLSYGAYYDSDGKRSSEIENGSGLKTMYDTYGLLWGMEGIENGQAVTRTSYYPNGSPKEIDPYKNGLVHGLRKTYFQGGEPKTIENWVEGKQEGITTLFQEGEKTQEIPYKNGLKNGVGRVYRDGAIVVQEICWKNDKMDGPTRTYIEDRVATEWYFKGNKVTKGYYDSFHFHPRPIETASEEVKQSGDYEKAKEPSAEHPNVANPTAAS